MDGFVTWIIRKRLRLHEYGSYYIFPYLEMYVFVWYHELCYDNLEPFQPFPKNDYSQSMM